MERGQGSIEYLLIIGAAILVVAVVIIALTTLTTTAGDQTGTDDVNDALNPLQCQQKCLELGYDYNASGCYNAGTKYNSGACAE